MTHDTLGTTFAGLFDVQGSRFARTAIPEPFHGGGGNKNLVPPLDRIASNRHSEGANLQVVCQFIIFWKSDTDKRGAARPLMLVQGQELEAP